MTEHKPAMKNRTCEMKFLSAVWREGEGLEQESSCWLSSFLPAHPALSSSPAAASTHSISAFQDSPTKLTLQVCGQCRTSSVPRTAQCHCLLPAASPQQLMPATVFFFPFCDSFFQENLRETSIKYTTAAISQFPLAAVC